MVGVKVRNGEGLELVLGGAGEVESVSINKNELLLNGLTGGFSVYKAERGPKISLEQPLITNLEAVNGCVKETRTYQEKELQVLYKGKQNHIEIEGKVKNLSSNELAFIIQFTLPIDAIGWYWSDDINNERLIRAHERYTNYDSLGIENDIAQSLLPFCAISREGDGISLAVPMHSPRVFRMCYDQQGLHISFDLGLTPLATNLKDEVDFKFIIYTHDYRWKIRSTAQIYYDLYPELFLRRTNRQGNWGGDLRRVDSWQDIIDGGYVFSLNGAAKVTEEIYEFLKENNLYCFKHREPWAWWHLVYPSEGPRPHPFKPQPSLEEEIELIKKETEYPEEIKDGNDQIPGPAKEVSQAAINCFLHDENGLPIRILWHDWTPGWHSQIPLNPDPKIPSPNRNEMARKYQFPNMDLWGKDYLATPGVSWDSLTRWTGFHIENFRQEHFQYIMVPPTFHYKTGKIVQIKGFHDWEAAKYWSQEVREKDKYLMSNTDTLMYMYCGQFIDVFGIERSIDEVDDAEVALARTLAYQKPITYIRPYHMEGLNRALFYAIGPGSARSFWQERGEEGRELTRRYMQAIETLGNAGWQPVTNAWVTTQSPKVYFTAKSIAPPKTCFIERYGDSPDNMYFTVRMGNSEGDATMCIDIKAIGVDESKQIHLLDLITGKKVNGQVADGIFQVPIEAERNQTLAFQLVTE